MAFGFIKKIFSFGKKEVVEETVSEETLPPAAEQAAPETARPAPEQGLRAPYVPPARG